MSRAKSVVTERQIYRDLKGRMTTRLRAKRVDQRELADLIGMQHRTVQRYLSTTVGEGIKVPAAFVVNFIRAVPTDAAWLLTGEGEPEPLPRGRAAERALRKVAKIVEEAQG